MVTQVGTKLTHHVRELADNRRWLVGCLEGKMHAFPYRIKESRKATFGEFYFEPRESCSSWPSQAGGKEPRYVIQLPTVDCADLQGKVHDILDLYKREAFGANPAESAAELGRRAMVMVGINRFQSLDSAINRAFRRQVRDLSIIEGIHYRILAFFWIPAWQPASNAQRYCYPREKAYQVLKAISPEVAKQVRCYFEGRNGLSDSLRKSIPYQGIRDFVLHSDCMEQVVEHFQGIARRAPIYLATMDDDTCAMRQLGGQGLYSRYDALIGQMGTLPVFSLGYRVPAAERRIIQLGVRLDMAVRQALGGVILFAPYVPEPGALFRIRSPGCPNDLDALTFLGAGRALESRRLVESGLSEGVFEEACCFIAGEGITTTTPARMCTAKNGRSLALNQRLLKSADMMKMVRAIPQSHIFPRQWAENVYAALPFKVSRKTDATKEFMAIHRVYDPIARMNDLAKIWPYAAAFDKVLKGFEDPLSFVQKDALLEARHNLRSLRMNEALIELVERAAHASGKALRDALSGELLALESR